jgi:hypothetical protein
MPNTLVLEHNLLPLLLHLEFLLKLEQFHAHILEDVAVLGQVLIGD